MILFPSCFSSQVDQSKVPLAASSPIKENFSLKKLHNSPFQTIESEQGIITRQKAKHVGVGSSSQRAVGFKLLDVVLLSQCISTSTYDNSNRLPEVFMEELDPIFIRLSKDDLLSRCLKGMTQNQNEAVKGQQWSKCSKTKFCGARRVRIAACETIAVFNTGAGSKAVTMKLCHVTPGVNTMKALREQVASTASRG